MAAHTPSVPDSRFISEAEYFNTDFEVIPDFVNGVLEERNVGGPEHTNWQGALMRWFFSQTFQALVITPEVTVRVAEGRNRIADLAIFSAPPKGTASAIHDVPVAVIEILSPSDSYRRVKDRLLDYEAMGVRNLFVVESRTTVTRFRDGQFLHTADRSALEGTDAFLDWPEAATFLWPLDPGAAQG